MLFVFYYDLVLPSTLNGGTSRKHENDEPKSFCRKGNLRIKFVLSYHSTQVFSKFLSRRIVFECTPSKSIQTHYLCPLHSHDEFQCE